MSYVIIYGSCFVSGFLSYVQKNKQSNYDILIFIKSVIFIFFNFLSYSSVYIFCIYRGHK